MYSDILQRLSISRRFNDYYTLFNEVVEFVGVKYALYPLDYTATFLEL